MCKPALGGRIKVEIDEFAKPARAYMLAITTSANTSQKAKSATQTNNDIQNMICLDMARYILICLDTHFVYICLKFGRGGRVVPDP